MYSVTIPDHVHRELKAHLIRPDGCEHAAYLLCSQASIEMDPWEQVPHRKFLASEVETVPEHDVIRSTETEITIRTESFVQLLGRATTANQVIAIVHNHPSGYDHFSSRDDDGEMRLIKGIVNRNGPTNAMLLSIVLLPSGTMFGRLWLQPSVPQGHHDLAMIRVIGPHIQLHCPKGDTLPRNDAFNRQEQAFGPELTRILRRLRIGIVGCGGTGSAVAALLGRLGVGKLVVFDRDTVETTNLNRLHGALGTDVDEKRLKSDVVARSIAGMGTDVDIIQQENWITDSACHDSLKSCDIIFGCTDDHSGRFLLNRFAYYYMVPVIDLGVKIVPSKDSLGPMSVTGRVSVIEPGSACMMCRNLINMEAKRAEDLMRKQPDQYMRRKQEAYVVGANNPAPAVVTFTTEIACVAVNELLHRLLRFRDQQHATSERMRQFHLYEDRVLSREPKENCDLCSQYSLWGKGDTERFLDRDW